jgi:hypothetical protein
MRMQQSDKLTVSDTVKESLKLGGTGTGTDFDLNNRDPDIEAIDEDAPSDGVHEVENNNNTFEGDATRQQIKPDSILDSQESVKLANGQGYYRPEKGVLDPTHNLHKERFLGANNSSLTDQTIMTDVGVRVNEGIQADGGEILVDEHDPATGGD